MPDPATLGLFLTAAFLLSITPGPGILYTLARTLHGGKAAGFASALGLCAGGLIHVVAAAIGLSGLLMTSALAFVVVKYVGAAYLIYLGLRTMLSRDSASFQPQPSIEPRHRRTLFYQGMVTEALNPKTALFFLAFIPQFIDVAQGQVVLQFLLLGLLTNGLNLIADLTVVTFADPIGQRLRTSARFRQGQRLASGGTLVGLGAYVAMAEQN